jgi:hypothetical protein
VTRVVITAPSTGFTWKVGDPIDFEGSATDRQDGTLPASALNWTVALQHCPSNCHQHSQPGYPGTDDGSFPAPDHEYPSHLDLTLTATDSGGLTDSRTIRLDPKTVDLSFATSPSGLDLGFNGARLPSPFTRSVIQGSANTVSGPSPQTFAGKIYDFGSWSDGGVASHTITANVDGSYTATFTARAP